MGAFLDFQKAVFTALNGDPALAALIGSGKVFDDVPHGAEGTAPAFPFVTIGDQTGELDGASGVDAAEMTIEVHAWSRGAGKAQCLEMLDLIRDAVEGPKTERKSHATANGTVVEMHYQGHQTVTEPDGETFHGVIRFGGFYQYG